MIHNTGNSRESINHYLLVLVIFKCSTYSVHSSVIRSNIQYLASKKNSAVNHVKDWKALCMHVYNPFCINHYAIMYNMNTLLIYVTGFWKTDWIATLGLFHYIGPANGYTCTLHIQSAITRLGWLVCFSRASFANPVNSWLRQWDPLGVLHGRHGSKIHPSDGETSLTPFKHFWAYSWHFWDP